MGRSGSQKKCHITQKTGFSSISPIVLVLFEISLSLRWARQWPLLVTMVAQFVVLIAHVERFQGQKWVIQVASKMVLAQKTGFPSFSQMFVSCLGIKWSLFREFLRGGEAALVLAQLP